MNEGVLSNRGLGIKAVKCLYEEVIVSTAGMKETEVSWMDGVKVALGNR